jgi:hypothetical protein
MSSLRTFEHYDASDLRDERFQWTSEQLEFRHCGFIWVAVYAVGADFLHFECKECGAFDSEVYEPQNTAEFHSIQ